MTKAELEIKQTIEQAVDFLVKLPTGGSLKDFEEAQIEFVALVETARANAIYKVRFPSIKLVAKKHVNVMTIVVEGNRFVAFSDEEGNLLDYRKTNEAHKHHLK